MRDIFEKEEDQQIDIPREERKLTTISYDYSVEFLVNLMTKENPKIILEVPFQRRFIWKQDRCSKLIESLIMNVPIPPLYFSEEKDGNWLVVDGLQRLNAIKTFYQNEYALKKLDIIKELEKLKYKDLPPKSKRLLDNGLLRINVIKYDSHPDIKYDIFMRLNTGAVSLNNQELRNCLNRGVLNDTIKKIVENKEVLRLLNLKKPHPRYLDVEFVIRYLAFSENLRKNEKGYYLENYKGSLKSFINFFMEKNTNIDSEQANKLRQKFLDVVKKYFIVFDSTEGLQNPASKSKQINKALADCILLSLERYDENKLRENKENINKLRNKLLSDTEFISLISKRTSDTLNINKRITTWFERLENAFNL